MKFKLSYRIGTRLKDLAERIKCPALKGIAYRIRGHVS
jgi:hypothetical protein